MSVFTKPGALARRALLCALLGSPILPLMAWSDEASKIGVRGQR